MTLTSAEQDTFRFAVYSQVPDPTIRDIILRWIADGTDKDQLYSEIERFLGYNIFQAAASAAGLSTPLSLRDTIDYGTSSSLGTTNPSTAIGNIDTLPDGSKSLSNALDKTINALGITAKFVGNVTMLSTSFKSDTLVEATNELLSYVNGTVSISNRVNSNSIENNSILDEDISPSANINGGKIAPLTINGGGADGAIAFETITGYNIADNAVTLSKMMDGSVDSRVLADNAVTTNKIANDSINSNKIIDGSITTADLIDRAITNAKINDVDASKLTTGTLNMDRIASFTITERMYMDDSITENAIVNNAITRNHLKSDVVDSSKIIDATIRLADLSSEVSTPVNRIGSKTLLNSSPGTVTVCSKSGSVYSLTSTVITGSDLITDMIDAILDCAAWVNTNSAPYYLTLTGLTSDCYEPSNALAACQEGIR